MLLYCVSTNYTQSLDLVDQALKEDSEIFFREQGGYHEHCEYTYNGWFIIVIAFMNSLVNLVKYYL